MSVAAIFPVLVSLVTAASVIVQPKSISRWWIPPVGTEIELREQIVVCFGMVSPRRFLSPDALASKDIQRSGGPDKLSRWCSSFLPGNVVRVVKSSPDGVCIGWAKGKMIGGFDCGWVQHYSLPDSRPLELR